MRNFQAVFNLLTVSCPKYEKGDDAALLVHDSWHFYLSFVKINDVFLNPDSKLDKIGITLEENFKFEFDRH